MAKFLNRSERNKDVVTPAMVIFGGKQILTDRPEGMTQEDYKILRNGQNKLLKKIFAKAPNNSINQYVNPNRKDMLKGFMNVRFKQRVTQRKTG